jgi:hypothetical protein
MPTRRNGSQAMPRKRKRTAAVGSGKRVQYNVSFDIPYAARIDETAATLGADSVTLIRMIVREHIAEYEARAQKVRDGEAKS